MNSLYLYYGFILQVTSTMEKYCINDSCVLTRDTTTCDIMSYPDYTEDMYMLDDECDMYTLIDNYISAVPPWSNRISPLSLALYEYFITLNTSQRQCLESLLSHFIVPVDLSYQGQTYSYRGSRYSACAVHRGILGMLTLLGYTTYDGNTCKLGACSLISPLHDVEDNLRMLVDNPTLSLPMFQRMTCISYADMYESCHWTVPVSSVPTLRDSVLASIDTMYNGSFCDKETYGRYRINDRLIPHVYFANSLMYHALILDGDIYQGIYDDVKNHGFCGTGIKGGYICSIAHNNKTYTNPVYNLVLGKSDDDKARINALSVDIDEVLGYYIAHTIHLLFIG